MSSRRQTLLARVNWYLQYSLKHITEFITGDKSYYRGGRYRQVSLYKGHKRGHHCTCWLPGTHRYKTMGKNAADYASSHGCCKITWAISVKFLSNQSAVRKFAKSRKISQYFKCWDDRSTTIHTCPLWGRGGVGWGGVWVGWGWKWKVGGGWGWGPRVSVCCKLEIWA